MARDRIYLVIVTLAVAQVLLQSLTDRHGLLGTSFGEPVHPLQVLLLLAILLTAMRFAHGSPLLSLVARTGACQWQPAVQALLRLLFSFRGRLNRKPFCVAIVLVGIATRASTAMLETAVDPVALAAFLSVTVLGLWACIALQAKRLHDIGLSAWFLLLNLIPVVGPPATLLFSGFKRGTAGHNRFGPDPIARAL